MGKSTISMAIFNSYFDITRGYLSGAPCRGCGPKVGEKVGGWAPWAPCPFLGAWRASTRAGGKAGARAARASDVSHGRRSHVGRCGARKRLEWGGRWNFTRISPSQLVDLHHLTICFDWFDLFCMIAKDNHIRAQVRPKRSAMLNDMLLRVAGQCRCAMLGLSFQSYLVSGLVTISYNIVTYKSYK